MKTIGIPSPSSLPIPFFPSLIRLIFDHPHLTTAAPPRCSLTGIANEQKKLYGTQFHPEVDLTERGTEILRNFLFEIAGCTSNFTVQNRQQSCITEIQEKVGKSKVLVRNLHYG